MPFVSCADLPNQINIAVAAMTPAQRATLCTALNCAPTVAAITVALMALPGAGVAGNILTISGGAPVFAPASTALSFVSGANVPGSVLTMVGAVPTFVPALPVVAKETATAVSTSLRPMTVAASGSSIRTFTNVSHDASFNTSFGTWDLTKTTFTFSKAGSYQFSASATLVAQVTAMGGVGTQGSASCDMVVNGVSYTIAGLNFDTGPNAGPFPSGTGGVTISLPNITVGTTARIDCGTNAPAAGANYNVWYGINGTAVGGGNSACGLFISTW
jgi:hypothetical protein